MAHIGTISFFFLENALVFRLHSVPRWCFFLWCARVGMSRHHGRLTCRKAARGTLFVLTKHVGSPLHWKPGFSEKQYRGGHFLTAPTEVFHAEKKWVCSCGQSLPVFCTCSVCFWRPWKYIFLTGFQLRSFLFDFLVLFFSSRAAVMHSFYAVIPSLPVTVHVYECEVARFPVIHASSWHHQMQISHDFSAVPKFGQISDILQGYFCKEFSFSLCFLHFERTGGSQPAYIRILFTVLCSLSRIYNFWELLDEDPFSAISSVASAHSSRSDFLFRTEDSRLATVAPWSFKILDPCFSALSCCALNSWINTKSGGHRPHSSKLCWMSFCVK